MSDWIVIGETERNSCFVKKIVKPDAYTIMSLLNHHAVGGSKTELESIDPRINAHLYEVRLAIKVDGVVTDVISQDAIFIGEPNFIPIEAVTNIVVSHSINIDGSDKKTTIEEFLQDGGKESDLLWCDFELKFDYKKLD